MKRIWATCDVENHASARVLEKAGLRPRGMAARPVVRPNLDAAARPSLLFSLDGETMSAAEEPS